MRRRNVPDEVKTGPLLLGRDEFGGDPLTDPGGLRRRGGVIPIQASVRNVGTCRRDAKGEGQAAETARPGVPMRVTGAERLVVVMKRSNVRGAKGPRHPVAFMGQPRIGRSRWT